MAKTVNAEKKTELNGNYVYTKDSKMFFANGSMVTTGLNQDLILTFYYEHPVLPESYHLSLDAKGFAARQDNVMPQSVNLEREVGANVTMTLANVKSMIEVLTQFCDSIEQNKDH